MAAPSSQPERPSAPAIDRKQRRRALRSALWAAGQQAILLGSTAVFGIVLARALPVAEFGAYSYATTLATMGMAIVGGGLGGLAIKEFLDRPGDQRRTMAALIAIRETFALIAYLLLVGVAVATSGSDLAIEASAIACLVLFARAWDGIEYWFQSRLESRATATVRILVVLPMLAIRVALVVLGAPLEAFLVLYVVESTLIACGLVARLVRHPKGPGTARPRLRDMRSLLRRSRLLLLSNIAGQIDMRADQVIIQAVIGSVAVGTYAAAAKISELTYFLPLVFMNATFPLLIDVRKRFGPASREYQETLQQAYDRACWAGVAIAVAIFLLGPTAISVLYGEKYEAAAEVLRIHILALPFVFMAGVLSKWILAEDVLMASLIRRCAGAALAIGLNLLLVPPLGIKGAAIATVVSYTVSSYVVCFAGRSMRPAGIQMSLALVAPIRLLLARTRAKGS